MDISKSLIHQSELANKYIALYYEMKKESDALQVVLKHTISSLKKGYLTENLIEQFLDLPQISQEAKDYIYDNSRTTDNN
jgi:hypothetical protein